MSRQIEKREFFEANFNRVSPVSKGHAPRRDRRRLGWMYAKKAFRIARAKSTEVTA